MARERGYFDGQTRAFINLRFPGGLANLQIDTGFNRHVLIGDATAARLGLNAIPGFVMAQPAGSAQPFRVAIAHVDVMWLGQLRRLDVLIYGNEQPRPRGEPDGLLGTGLIHPGKLVLDYLSGIVEISE